MPMFNHDEHVRQCRVLATDGQTPELRKYFGALVGAFDRRVAEGEQPVDALMHAGRDASPLLPESL
jgi:hypothetical protein